MGRHLDRHDQVLMARRRTAAGCVNNRPRWGSASARRCWSSLIVTVVLAVTVTGVVAATVMGVYNEYAAQLPDVGVIEQEQDQFQTVRIYDRTGKNLLYESVDPRPFGGDRRFMALDKMSPWVWQAAVALEDRNFLENPGDQRPRPLPRLCLEPAGRRRAGRLVHHPAADQERGDPGRGAHAAELRPQDQGSASWRWR